MAQAFNCIWMVSNRHIQISREYEQLYLFREIDDSLLKIVKSEFFAKQIIFSNSSPHRLTKVIYHLSAFYEFGKIYKNDPKWTHFTKIANKIPKSEYFSEI